jgi:hypothetical protein
MFSSGQRWSCSKNGREEPAVKRNDSFSAQSGKDKKCVMVCQKKSVLARLVIAYACHPVQLCLDGCTDMGFD